METGTDLSSMDLTQPQNLSFSGAADRVEVKLTTDDGKVFETLSPVDFTITLTNPSGNEEQFWFTPVTLLNGAGNTIELEILTRHVETDGAVAAVLCRRRRC